MNGVGQMILLYLRLHERYLLDGSHFAYALKHSQIPCKSPQVAADHFKGVPYAHIMLRVENDPSSISCIYFQSGF